MSSPFEISPVKLVYGGEALAFHAGRTVFAPRVLPGERAEVETVREQKGVIHARPLRILEPSPERVEPACRYFGRCGGCQYQHLPYAAQLKAKAEILRETLGRLGKVRWDGPIRVHSGPAWNYRNQAQLKVRKSAEGGAALGFFEAESNCLVPIQACPILSPRLNALLAVLQGEPWINLLARGREVELLADDRDEKVMLALAGSWNAQESEALARKCLAELDGVATVAFAESEEVRAGADRGPNGVRPRRQGEKAGRSTREPARESGGLRVFGEPHLAYRVGEFVYRVSPAVFFQSSRHLLPDMVAAVTGNESGSVAMDLYAGVGLFTLPLASSFDRVIAVEAHPQAAADLAANARALPGGRIQAVAATTLDFLRRCAQMAPDLVVMDPPRGGVEAAPLKLLVALRPKRIHYVSCSPPTLARDLGFLLNHGYHLDALEMFDCFPQTYHIESLARLSRGGGELA